MNFGEFRNGKAQQPLSAGLKPYEADLDHFAELCNQTCARVMRLLALGLEVYNIQTHTSLLHYKAVLTMV
jgi:isopenicillin N synthase-like dioxygenase